MDEERFLKSIMNKFQCSRRMAETIYKASEKTNELEQIKFLAGEEGRNKE